MSILSKPLLVCIQGCLFILCMIKRLIKGSSRSFAFAVFVFSIAFNSLIQASPAGGNIVGGSGSINQSGSTTTIQQSTQSLAIDWHSFNVSKNETVNFLQPGASSIALNRILSNNPSQIFGQINANGQVVLVNPSGIFFGRTASVNVGGLIASGLDISASDFMNGDYIFNEVLGSDGTIINSGLINASLGGNVALIGKQVANEGVINAQLGSVALATGKEAVLTFDTVGLIGVRVSKAILQEDIGVDPALLNTGEITADGGQVLLTASVSKDVFSQAVNSGGIEQATSVVVNEDGTFTLGAGADVTNTGTINTSSIDVNHGAGQVVVLGENVTSSGSIESNSDSSNAGIIEIHAKDKTVLEKNSYISATSTSNDGGVIKVLGNKVGLFDHSIVDASGELDGGRVLIGGDYQGSNAGIRNASISYVGEDATIKASSDSEGNGGNVIVWSDNTTRFYGSILAEGGLLSGDGGFAEVSGKEYLDFNGDVNLSAEFGQTGTLLLDPNNIVIASSFNFKDIAYTGSTDQDYLDDYNAFNENEKDDSGVDIYVTVFAPDLITDILTGGNGKTQASVVLEARGDIWVKEAIDISTHSGNTQSLTLRAGDDIEIDAEIKLAGGKLTISQGDAGCSTAGCINFNTLIYDVGSVLDINNDLSTTGGEIILGNADEFGETDFIKIGSASNTTINISTGDSSAGSITFNDQVYDDDSDSFASILKLTAGSGDITFNNNIGSSTTDNLGMLEVTSANTVTLQRVYAGYVDTTNNGIDITANTIELSGNIRSDSDASPGNINFDGDVLLLTDVNVLTAGGLFTITGALNTDISTTHRIIAITAGSGDVTIDGLIGTATGGRLGIFNITSANDVSLGTTGTGVGLNANTVTVTSSNSFNTHGHGISTAGIDGDTATPTGNTNGGNVNITATTSIDIASIDSHGGNVHSTGNANGSNAGEVSLTAASINVGKINASGGTAYGSGTTGGSGNTITLTTVANAGLESVTLTGDIDSRAGVDSDGVTRGDEAVSSIVLDDDASDVSGAVHLENIGPFTSSLAVTGTIGDNEALYRSNNLSNTSNWDIDAANGGNINSSNITFSNIESLIGGDGVDNFTFNSNGLGDITGLIDGGSHSTANDINDTVDFRSSNKDVTVKSGSSLTDTDLLTNVVIDVAYIETVTGYDGKDNTLIGPNDNTNWYINGTNSGSLGGSALTTTPTQGAVMFSNFTSLQGGDANDSFTFSASGTITGLVDGGTGLDELNLAAANTSVQLASAGNTGNSIVEVTRVENIIGNSAYSNILIGENSNTNWYINGTNSGSLGGNALTTTPTQGAVMFSNFSSLQGGDANDSFAFYAGGSISSSIDAAGGDDTVDYSNLASVDISIADPFNGVANAEIIKGNNTNSTLTAGNTSNIWDITDENDGTVAGIRFIDFNNIIGGTLDDTFTFSTSASTITGLIDGGTGVDELNLAATNTTVQLVSAGNTTNNIVDVTRVENIIGNSAYSNILIGENSNTNWYINGTNSGSLGGNALTTTPTQGAVMFSNFSSLQGGDANDSFTLSASGNITGLLDGGTGLDELYLAAANTTVQLALAGDTTNNIVEVTRVENIIGNSAYSNILIGENSDTNWYINGTNSGSLGGNALTTTPTQGVVMFSNFASLQGGDANDSFAFYAGASISSSIDAAGGDDTVDYSNLASVDISIANPFNGVANAEIIKGNNTNSTLTAGNASNSWDITDENDGTVAGIQFIDFNNIIGGTLDDTFTFSTSASNITGLINGGTGLDELNLAAANTTVQLVSAGDTTNNIVDVTRVENIIGNSGFSNILIGENSNTNWYINGTNSGSLGGNALTTTPTQGAVMFNNFSSLQGGDANDSFTFYAGGSISNSIDAAGGDDTVDYSNLDSVDISIGSTFNGVSNAEIIKGNNTNSTLTAGNASNIWDITDENDGTVAGVQFIDFNNIIGGTLDDTFTFSTSVSNITGLLDGGTGLDELNLATTNTTVQLASAGNTGNSIVEVTRVENIIGNSAYSNILIGENSNTNWYINGTNSGSLGGNALTTTPTQGAVMFSNFASLQGGDANDSFAFYAGASISSSIDAAGGDDTVDYSNLASVDISIADPFNGVANAEIIKGNNTNSTLTAGNTSNIWDITDENDGTVAGIRFIDFNNIIGGTLDDTFTFSTSASTITGLIDGGTGVDELNLAATNTTVQLVSAGNTTNNIVDVTRVENIIGNSAYSNILIGENSNTNWYINGTNSGSLGGNALTTTPTQGAVMFSNFSSLQGGDANDSFTLSASGTITGLVDGGTGVDELNLAAANTTVQLASAGDTTNNIVEVTRVENIIGNSGFSNILIGENSNTNWYINGTNSGSLGGSALTTTPTQGAVMFSNFSSLQGGDANDSFAFYAGASISSSIDAAGGDDTVDYSNLASVDISIADPFNGVANAEIIKGNNTNSTLTAGNTSNIWDITDENDGTVAGIRFIDFNNIIGGTLDDTFTFSASASTITGLIDGGTGLDELNLATTNTTVQLASAGNTGNSIVEVTRVENIIGNSAYSNILIGENSNTNWYINGTNSGSLGGNALTTTPTQGVVMFSNFASLQGGDANDSFAFYAGASISSSIDAASGDDTVDYSNLASVDISIADPFNGVANAEIIKGNNTNSTLTAGNTSNIWDITDENDGTVAGIRFIDFNNIIGGTLDDTFTFSASASTITGLIDGGTGLDELNLATTNTTVQLASAGNTGNSIVEVTRVENIIGNSAYSNILIGENSNTNWYINGTNSGSLGGSDLTTTPTVGAVMFSNFSSLQGGDANDSFAFYAGASISSSIDAAGGDDTVDYSNLASVDISIANPFNGVANAEIIKGNNTNSTLTAGNTSNIWDITDENDGTVAGIQFIDFNNIIGGTLDDTFTFSTSASNITGLINGGTGLDELNLAAANTTVQLVSAGDTTNNIVDVTRVENIIGNSGFSNILIGENSNTNWYINGTNSGSLGGNALTTTPTQGVVMFSNFASLQGGDANDSFAFYAGASISSSIDAAGGDDTVDYSNLASVDIIIGSAFNGVSNAEIIKGNNTNSTLTAGNTSNIWDITDENDGTVAGIRFIDFNNIIGGTQDDTFTFSTSVSTITGLIDGGTGVDELNLAATNTTVQLASAGNTGNSIVDVTRIENIIGNSTYSNILIGENSDTNWYINGTNSGSLGGTALTTTPTQGAVMFSNFSSLQGGMQNDRFSFSASGNITGLLDGGTGLDELNLAAANTTVQLALAGDTTNNIVEVTRVENIIGNSAYSNILIGENSNTNWYINGTNSGSLGGNALTTTPTQGVVMFSNFASLQGGDANDSFSFYAGASISSSIDAASGDDTVDYSNLASVDISIADPFNGVANAEIIKGNNTNSTLTAGNTSNIWDITDENDGTVAGIQFIDFNNIIGGTLDDTFTFSTSTSNITGLVDGGTGVDELNLAATNTTVQLVSAGNTTNNIVDVTRVENIIGNSTYSNILIGENSSTNWYINGTNSGSLGGSDLTTTPTVGAVMFSNFSSLQGGDANDSFAFYAGGSISSSIDAAGGDDTVDYSNLASVDISIANPFNGVANAEIIKGNNTNSTLTAGNASNSWDITDENDGTVAGIQFIDFNNIIGGTLDDTFTFSTSASNITGLINGGTGLDELNLAAANTTVQLASAGDTTNNIVDVTRVENIIGNSGFSNILIGENSNTNWYINGTNSGSLGGNALTTTPTQGAVMFNNFSSLQGGDANDSFAFYAGGSISSSIDAAGGDDTVDYSNLASVDIIIGSAFNGVSNAEIIKGNNTNSTLTAGNTSNIWDITDENDGTVAGIRFIDFNNIIGGTQDDTFTFSTSVSTITGMIDGGTGVDELNLAATNTTVQLASAGNTGNSIVEVTRVENIIGNSAYSNILIGENSNTNWYINGTNSGSLGGNALTTTPTQGVVMFSNFSSLQGGDANDSFAFYAGGSISSSIDAAGGDDTVDYSNLASVDISIANPFNGVANAEIIKGNNTNSTLRADSVNNTWNINGPNDGTLAGIDFYDFNILVGGGADDSFNLLSGGSVGSIYGGDDGTIGDHLIVNSDFGSNVWVLSGDNTGTLNSITAFSGIETITGSNGELTGPSVNSNTWKITANQSGTLNSNLTFSGMNAITGGSTNDYFEIANNVTTANLSGGDGDNSLVLLDGSASDLDTNIWNLTAAASGNVKGNIVFTKFNSLYGNNGADQFVFFTDLFHGSINGAAGIDDITAYTTDNTWVISGSNSGTIMPTSNTNILSFSSIENLIGNTGNDSFTVNDGGEISGTIDGDTGIDALYLTSKTSTAVTVKLGSTFITNADGTFNTQNLETVTAYSSNDNHIIGADTEQLWVINEDKSGAVGNTLLLDSGIPDTDTEGVTKFSGFNNILGGSDDDSFRFIGNTNNLASVDGGAEVIGDTIDMSQITKVSIEIAETDSTGYKGIEGYRGNNTNSTLIATDTDNLWVISGQNDGTVAYGTGSDATSFTFKDFNILQGGDQVDTFVVSSGGSVEKVGSNASDATGIYGGAGDDSLTVQLNGSETGAVELFDGGEGSDTISMQNVAMGNSGFGQDTYTPEIINNNILATHRFENFDSSNTLLNSYAVTYQNVETINDNITAGTLQISGTTSDDAISLSSSDFTVVSSSTPFKSVDFTHKSNISVAGGTGADSINLSSAINLGSSNLSLGAETIQGNHHLITASALTLDTTSSTTTLLQTSVDSLSITNSNTASTRLSINEADSIALEGIALTGNLNLTVAAGDITQSNNLSTGAALALIASNGNIRLNGSGNELSGPLSLAAASSISLNNTVTTDLALVQANELTIISNADINDSGNVTVNLATLNAGVGSIQLDSAGNDFDFLTIASAESVLVHDVNNIQLGNINMGTAAGTGTFELISTGVSQESGTVFKQQQPAAGLAGQVTFNAGAGRIELDHTDNQFAGPVILKNTGDNAVTISDTDSLVFGESSIGSGTFSVTASSGVSQTGSITQQANAAAVTINAGAGVIDLSNSANSFTGAINLRNSGMNAVRFTNNNAINIASADVGGVLNMISTGGFDITQTGAISVAGAASFSVDAGQSVLLDLTNSSGTPLNHFQQALSIQANNGGALQDVQIANDTALTLAGLNLEGDLQILADGTVSESAAWTVAGDTIIDSSGAAVTLSNSANDFNQIAFVDAADVSLTDSNSVILGTNTDSNNISGSLSVTTQSGDILENSASSIRVDGTTSLNAAAGSGNVDLAVASNDFNIVSISRAQHVTLADTNQITLNSTTINGDINVTAGGSIEDGVNGLSVAGLTSFTTRSGENITLDNTNNQLNGLISLNAPGSLGNVVVTNNVNTALGAVAANNLSIFSAGNISQQGGFNVANETHLNANSASSGQQDIILRGVGSNSLNQLWVENAHDVIIDNSANDLTINQMNASGLIDITARNLTSSTALSAAGITFNASGNATFNASVDSTAGIEVFAGDVVINGQVSAANDLNITTNTGGVTQNANLASSSGDITVDSASQIGMSDSASTVTSNGDINYSSEGSISLGSLAAQNHDINLISNNGSINDPNGSGPYLIADSLTIRSATGVGVDDARRLNTQVAVMDVINSGAGSIWLAQTGDLEIVNLQATANGTRIDVNANSDITFNPGSVAVSRDSGSVFMTTQNGSFYGNGLYDIHNADITAYDATFFSFSPLGTFGSTGRPIVMDVPKNGSILIDAYTNSIRYYPETPDNLETKGIDIGSLGVLQAISGEQLVEVESLGEIDPAIFTELRNYSSVDISIRMPRDQLYDDELTEEDQEETEKVSAVF